MWEKKKNDDGVDLLLCWECSGGVDKYIGLYIYL